MTESRRRSHPAWFVAAVAFIALMGADGLRLASQSAILAANYVARRLSEHFPVLYTGEHGDVAHECIVDLRPITKETGVSVDDVAKRLIDFASGLCYALNGTMEKVATGVYLLKPSTRSTGYDSTGYGA